MAYGYQYAGYAPQYQERRSGPASVHVVAVIQYLGGLAVLAVAALLALVVAGSAGRTGQVDNYFHGTFAGDAATACYVAAGVIALVGLIAIWLGRKLQVGRNWARIVLIVLNGLSVAGYLYDLVQGMRGGALAGAVVPVLCLVLLNTRAARSWCRYRTW